MTTPTTTPQPFAHEAHAYDWLKAHNRPIIAVAVAAFVVVSVVRWYVNRVRGRRRFARARISEPIAQALGNCPVTVKKSRLRDGSVTYMRLAYPAGARDHAGNNHIANLDAILEERMGGPVQIDWAKTRGIVTVQLARPAKAVEQPAASLAERAEDLVQRLLGPEATIEASTFKIDGRFQEFQVRHKSIKDPDREFRLGVDHIIQDKLGQRLDSDWDKLRDRIIYRAIPDLPTYVPHPTTTTTDDRHIPFAVDARGTPATWDLGYAAHCLIVGQTGSGKSVTVFTLVTELTARGIPVRACDPKMIGLLGLVGWPNVTLSTDTAAIVATILDTEAEMKRRFQAVLAGQVKEADLEPLVLLVDELWTAFKQIDDAWANRPEKAKDDPKVAPARDALTNMLRMGRQARVHIICAIQRPDAKIFDGAEARNNFGCAIVCGSPDAATTRMLGFTTTISDAPKGRAVVNTGHGEQVVQVWVTPDPADYRKLNRSEREIIDNLRAAAERAAFHVAPPAAPQPVPVLEALAAVLPFVPRIVEDTPPPTTKRCRGECGQTRPLEDFGRDKHRPDGLNVRCRECDRAEVAARRAAKRPVSTGSGKKAP